VSFSSDKALVIVDDEKSYSDLLAKLLGDSLRCPIRAFVRPLDALAAIPGLNAGLIVTDYYMPGINGLEFVRRLQSVAPDVPVVMITGHMMELADTDYSDLPALKTILAKPFSWRLLADEIIRHWPEPEINQKASASL
jgi:DNA-binding NtrC family response regulator